MEVLSFASRERMGQQAAEDVATDLRARLRRSGNARIIFAAAPSQSAMLDALVQAEGIDWSRVTAFHMDEYIGLAPDAPQRFAAWLDRHLFSRVPFEEVHPLLPEPSPEEAAARYAAQLSEAPVDIVCLGIGVNGHLAFNDPPVADFEDAEDVKIVELDDICRQQQVDDDCFDTFEDVPAKALTLTIPRLLRADALYCVVPGHAKRAAVAAMLAGPITTACPASILREQAHCRLYLDPESDPDA